MIPPAGGGKAAAPTRWRRRWRWQTALWALSPAAIVVLLLAPLDNGPGSAVSPLGWGALSLGAVLGGVALAGRLGRRRHDEDGVAGPPHDDTPALAERLLARLPAIIWVWRIGPQGAPRLLHQAGDVAGVSGWPATRFEDPGALPAVADHAEAGLHHHLHRAAAEETASWEWRLRRPDGRWQWMRTTAWRLGPLRDGVAEVLCHSIDIERERSIEASAASAARLASLSEMAAGLPHELRQPLQAISLAAELAQMEARRSGATEIVARLDTVAVQAQRAAQVIDVMRRLVNGTEAGSPLEQVALQDAVGTVLLLTGPLLREAHVVVETALPDPAPVVLGRRVAIEQVLINLLINARDALAQRADGAERWVCIAAERDEGDTLRLSVSDTGGGIPAAVMARLFQPFVTSKPPETGTGLGLHLCRRMLRTMDATIEACNTAQGAVFTITLRTAPLPARQPEDMSAEA